MEGRKAFKNEWTTSFLWLTKKEKSGEQKVTRHWDGGELRVLLTRSHSAWAPRCVRRGVTCWRVHVSVHVCCWKCRSLRALLHRSAPLADTGGSVPLLLAPGGPPAEPGPLSNGSVPEGEAGWPAGVGFDLCESDFSGMQKIHISRNVVITAHHSVTYQHGVRWTSLLTGLVEQNLL